MSAKAPNLLQRSPGGNWTFRVKRTVLVDGVKKCVEKWISTGTSVKATALVEARRLMAEVDAAKRAGRWQDLERLHFRADEAASLGELEGLYRERIARESERTPGLVAQNAYWAKLRAVVACGRGVSEDAVAGLPVSVLSGELVKSFRVNWLASVAAGDLAGDASRRRSGDSMLRQARACFSGAALRCYSGAKVPDLSGFLKAGGFGARTPEHAEIGRGALAEMAAAADVLRVQDARLYVVHLLHKFVGLRNNEVAAARVWWFRRLVYGGGRPDQWVCEISERTCSRLGYLPKDFSYGQVPVTREVMAELAGAWRVLGIDLEAAVASESADAFCVPAEHKTGRYDVVYRDHSDFMRRFLPLAEFGKAGYELRRWARQRMAGKYRSREVGEAFIRHAGPADAGRHYQARFYAWGELGDNVGITLDEARGGVVTGATAEVRTGFAGV